jgi:hypothetical protein
MAKTALELTAKELQTYRPYREPDERDILKRWEQAWEVARAAARLLREDIFVIAEKELSLREQDELYYAFSELIPRFRRDIAVLVYDINGLKRIPTWQTLNLVKDACFVYDRACIKKLFKRILQEAEEHGIIYGSEEKVFKLKKAGRLVFSLKDNIRNP